MGCASGYAGKILESLKTVIKGADIVLDSNERREMCAFVEATRGDIRLEELDIKWDDAVMLCGGFLVRGCKLRAELKTGVKRALMQFFLDAKECSHGELMGSTEVMKAVSAPGAVEKNKVFSFKTEVTEEKYAGRCARLVLMALRVHQAVRENDRLIGSVEMSNELNEAVANLEMCLLRSNAADTYPSRGREGLRTSESNTKDLDPWSRMQNPGMEIGYSFQETGAPDCLMDELDATPVSCDSDETRHDLSRLVNNVLRLIFHEKSSLANGARTSFASSFISCLLVTRSGSSSPRLCEGREISPTLAALAYAAGCCGVLSIRKWPTLNAESELERIKELHSPGGRYGINLLQEMAAKTRLTRNAESSRALWTECREVGHRNCGYIGGEHLSANKVGKVVLSMQEELHEALL